MIAALTVNGVRTNSDVTVSLTVSQNKIIATGEFNSLKIDHSFFRIFELAGIANKSVKKIRKEIYNADTFLISLPVLGNRAEISSVAINFSVGSVAVVVDVGFSAS